MSNRRWKLPHSRSITVALVTIAITALVGPFMPAAANSANTPLYDVHDSYNHYFNYQEYIYYLTYSDHFQITENDNYLDVLEGDHYCDMLSWARADPFPYSGNTADTLSPTDWNTSNTPVYLSVYLPSPNFYWATGTDIHFEGRILPETWACSNPGLYDYLGAGARLTYHPSIGWQAQPKP